MSSGSGGPDNAWDDVQGWIRGFGFAAFLYILIVGVGFRVPPADIGPWTANAVRTAGNTAAALWEKVTDTRCAAVECDENGERVGAPLPLTAVKVGPERTVDDYRRAKFGTGWASVDGCDTRQRILARDLKGETRDGCKVLTGELVDPYTGQAVTFTRARPSAVQIDHVVALCEAWDSGAWKWSQKRREAYANDPAVLAATAGHVNQTKGCRDAGEPWCDTRLRAGKCPPGHDLRPLAGPRACAFARRTITIKQRHGLTVDPRERDALARMKQECDR